MNLSCREVTIRVYQIPWSRRKSDFEHFIIKNRSLTVRFMEMQMTSEKNGSLLAPAPSGFLEFKDFVDDKIYLEQVRDVSG